jgi:hypothetical protein
MQIEKSPLRTRFEEFVKTFDGYESIRCGFDGQRRDRDEAYPFGVSGGI